MYYIVSCIASFIRSSDIHVSAPPNQIIEQSHRCACFLAVVFKNLDTDGLICIELILEKHSIREVRWSEKVRRRDGRDKKAYERDKQRG